MDFEKLGLTVGEFYSFDKLEECGMADAVLGSPLAQLMRNRRASGDNESVAEISLICSGEIEVVD